jgi:hypothetical protein
MSSRFNDRQLLEVALAPDKSRWPLSLPAASTAAFLVWAMVVLLVVPSLVLVLMVGIVGVIVATLGAEVVVLMHVMTKSKSFS